MIRPAANRVRYYRPVLFMALVVLFVLPVVLYARQPLSSADGAWQSLSSQRERFWKDMEDSPALVARSAWPLINSLKFFIQYYPDSSHVPEAYYVLGEAYSAISWTPEATARWKAVVRYYPHSEWAGPALTALVRQLELNGNREKILRFYKGILRQFPDSEASLMARILLAEDAFKQGKTQVARHTLKQLENIPSIELRVPEFLRFKAMMAEQQGGAGEACDYLLRYINLVKSRDMRASALFRIAEIYRRQGRILEARKYYALVRRDFDSEPEALFARFRLAQMDDAARGRLSEYVSSGLKPEDMSASARLYARIVKELPLYPLTQEVQMELVRLRLRQGKYLEALKTAYAFLNQTPDSVYATRVMKYAMEAVRILGEHRQTIAVLQDFIRFGVPIVQSRSDNALAHSISRTVRHAWLSLMRQMIDAGQHENTLEEYRRYSDIYAGLHDDSALAQVRPLGIEALRGLDTVLLKQKQYIRLVNYHFSHQDMIRSMKISWHWYAIARSWQELSCPAAAMRAYYSAWQLKPDAGDRCGMLEAWTKCAVDSRDSYTAGAVMQLLDKACPDDASSAPILECKARIQVLRERWREATALFRDSVRLGGGITSRVGLLESSIMTGDWATARKLRDRIWKRVPEQEKKRLLLLWGDEAFNLHRYRIAMQAYEAFLDLTPEDPAVAWRLARAEELSGRTRAAMDELRALSQVDSPLWAGVADITVKNREFWESVPGDLK